MTNRLRRTALCVIVSLVLGVLVTGTAHAQVRFGGQLNVADDTDFGLGPRIAVDFRELGPRVQILGTWDIYFPEQEGLDFWELNGNVVYRFDLPETDVAVPYGGAGLNIARIDREGPAGADVDETELGLNVLGGVEFPLVSLTPFVELRATAEGASQLYFTAGVLIP